MKKEEVQPDKYNPRLYDCWSMYEERARTYHI